MVKRRIKLPRFAYDSIISGASEVWKREVYGLIGGRGKIVYYITEVSHHQTAKRKYSKVDPFEHKEATIKDAIKMFGGRVIGDFHSHNYYNDFKMDICLSETDKRFLRNHPEFISILVCTEEVNGLHNYWRLRDNIIYGPTTSRDSKNKIHKLTTAFVVYYYDSIQNRILKAKLEPTNGLERRLINY